MVHCGVRRRPSGARPRGASASVRHVDSPVSTRQLLRWSESLAAIARTGLGFTESLYERERFEEVLRVAADIGVAAAEGASGVEDAEELVEEWLRAVGEGVPGYVTPKVAVGAAVGNDKGELLLVKRADSGVWLYPTGWADVGYSAAEVVVKEVLEETGIEAEPLRLIAVLDGLAPRIHARAPVLPGLSLQGGGWHAPAPPARVRGRGVVRRGRPSPTAGRRRAMEPSRVRGAAGRASRRPVRPTSAAHVARRGAHGLTSATSSGLSARRARLSPSLGVESEADPAHGDEVLRTGGVALELHPQAAHVGVEGARVGEVASRPQPVDQLVAGPHLARGVTAAGPGGRTRGAKGARDRSPVVTTRRAKSTRTGPALTTSVARHFATRRWSARETAAGTRGATRPGCGPPARADGRAW